MERSAPVSPSTPLFSSFAPPPPRWLPAHVLPAMLLIGAVVGATYFARAEATPAGPSVPPGQGGPVVLQLFTSQGCSSCPPADRLLSRLGERAEYQGRILPLAFHVDYWNYIGWQDPFSDPAWSRRQEAFAAAAGSSRIYTPQLLINGEVDCNGSDASCVERALRQALARSYSWQLALTVEAPSDGSDLAVHLVGEPTGAGPLAGPRGFLAVTESGFRTAVGRGENARRTLENDYVVRKLVPFGLRDGRVRETVPLSLAAEWRREQLHLAAWLEDAGSLHVLGAVVAPPGALTAASPGAASPPR